jgi:hypothetical protein
MAAFSLVAFADMPFRWNPFVICASDDMEVVIHGGGHRRGVDLARIFVINSRELSSSRSGDYCSSPSHHGDGGKGS